MSEDVYERIRRIAGERERIAREEAESRAYAQQELERLQAEIDRLEDKKEALEAFLNIDPARRLEHGRIRDLCFRVLERHPDGLTSGQIKEIIERENPNVRVGSVPASLSYQIAQGRLKRDTQGRYTLTQTVP